MGAARGLGSLHILHYWVELFSFITLLGGVLHHEVTLLLGALLAGRPPNGGTIDLRKCCLGEPRMEQVLLR